MPRAPRSWTANSSSGLQDIAIAGCVPQAVTESIHDRQRRLVVPREAVPPQHAVRADDAHGARRVALHERRRRTTRRAPRGRARSRPGGRTPTHSSSPSSRRTSQLDSPSANRRAPFSGIASTGRRVTRELRPGLPLRPAGSSARRSPRRSGPAARGRAAAGRSRARRARASPHSSSGRARKPASASSSRATGAVASSFTRWPSFRARPVARKAGRSASVDVSTPYIAIHVVRASGWQTARSVRVDDAACRPRPPAR